MAGSFIQVEFRGLKSLTKAINKLLKQGQNLEPALREVGEYLVESTQQRFVDMQAPDGSPWEPLELATIAKKKRPERILTESGTLADTLSYQLETDALLIGSNMEYAATHQFGRDEIPARPFLGIAPFERDEVLNILHDHLDIEIHN